MSPATEKVTCAQAHMVVVVGWGGGGGEGVEVGVGAPSRGGQGCTLVLRTANAAGGGVGCEGRRSH